MSRRRSHRGALPDGGGPAPTGSCATSGRRVSDRALVLERGSKDRPGGRVTCLLCGRRLRLVQGPWVRAVAPAHSGAGGRP